MLCLSRICLCLSALICAVHVAVYAQNETDNFENIDSILNDLMHETELNNNCASVDLSALKAGLTNSIRNIFSLEEQQIAQVDQLIDNVFKTFETYKYNETISTSTEHALPFSEIGICLSQEECVEISKCKTSTLGENGQNRSLHRCSENKVCCHVSDKIQPTPAIIEMKECGLSNISRSQSALASDEASFGEFPWMVALLQSEQISTVPLVLYIGGGSLVAPNMVITAAHKVVSKPVDNLFVRVGEWNCSNDVELYAHQELAVMQIIIHEEYVRDQNDIALLVLKGAFTPKPHVSPICLPSAGLNFDYSHCLVAGWGKRDVKDSEYSSILKKVVVPVLSQTECNSKLRKVVGPLFRLHRSLICAGGHAGKDACLGDGGAPLVCSTKDNPDRFYQVGIVTWGVGCGLADVPGVYANMTYFMNWVSQKLRALGIDSKYYTA